MEPVWPSTRQPLTPSQGEGRDTSKKSDLFHAIRRKNVVLADAGTSAVPSIVMSLAASSNTSPVLVVMSPVADWVISLAAISPTSPLVELIAAVGAAALYWWEIEVGGYFFEQFLAHAILFALMIIATFIDIEFFVSRHTDDPQRRWSVEEVVILD